MTKAQDELSAATLIQSSRTAAAVVDAAREMHRAGLTVGSLGNVSVRRGDRIWITPTRVSAADLSPAKIVVIGVDGRPRSRGSPSRELPLHLRVYQRYDSVTAIAHSHSPWATAWSYLQEDLAHPTEELAYYDIKRIPCAPAARAGSTELARGVTEALSIAPAVLLANHGVVAVGSSPRHALELCAVVEQQAQVQWLLRMESTGRATTASRAMDSDRHATGLHAC